MALEIVLVVATVLCGLVAGLLFCFAVVVMPGIRALDDGAYLRAFQVVDGVIQRGRPLFGVVWAGSALAVVAALALGLGALAGTDRILLALAGALWLLGVQLPTFVVNIPLNNAVQAVDVASADDQALAAAREAFEGRWNRANAGRTVIAVAATALLAALLLRM